MSSIKTYREERALGWMISTWSFHSSDFKMISLIVLFVLFNVAAPQAVVKTLPGYSAADHTLPFKLETGYVTVGKMDDVELFYYFIESERDPNRDPLMLWLSGGPGCSAFSGLVFEIGPIGFDFDSFDGSLPSLLLNPYSWTKIANIIFLDSPVGAGFSYATTQEGYNSSDTKATENIYTFLEKWLLGHPKFIKNRLYIGGDSYGGKFVPLVAFKVSEGIEAGLKPRMNLQGYVIGNPFTDNHIDGNAKLPFAHRLAILSDEYYKMAKVNCNGEYANPDPTNAWCLYALQFYQQCIRNIFQTNILQPACKFTSSKPEDVLGSGIGKKYLEDDDSLVIRSHPQSKNTNEYRCQEDNYVLSYVWANDLAVQEALHIRNGTIKEWKRCNRSLWHDKNVESVVDYHQLLIKKGYEALVYSGDHDMLVPYIGTLEWIRLLNLTIDDNWRSWIVDAQVAGYTERYIYKKMQSHLTFATVKGAGHVAPETKPKECFAMVKRFFESYPL